MNGPISIRTGSPRAAIARAAILVLLVFASLFASLLLAACNRPHDFNGTAYDPVIPAADFHGTNWDGSPFSLSDLRGKVVLLFFGYTSCPDVCPTTLADMKVVKSKLGAQAEDVAVVFVSVDPERDDTEHIGAYMNAFDPTFYGVSIPADRLEQVKKDYGVFAQKHELDPSRSAAGYLIDHTAWTYVVDKQGNLRLVFSLDMAADKRTEDVAYLARQ